MEVFSSSFQIDLKRLKKNSVYTILDNISYIKILKLKKIKKRRIFNYYLSRRRYLEKLIINCEDCLEDDSEKSDLHSDSNSSFCLEKKHGINDAKEKSNITFIIIYLDIKLYIETEMNENNLDDYRQLDKIKKILCSKFYEDPTLTIILLQLKRLVSLEISELVNLKPSIFNSMLNNLESLKYLILKEISFNSTVFNSLSIMTNTWNQLYSLTINNSLLDDEGVKTIASASNWTNLKELNLNSNQIRDIGAKSIALNKSWSLLEHIFLENNLIGKEGGEFLAASSAWLGLKVISLKNNNIYKRTYIDLNTHSEKRRNTLTKRKFSSLTGK